MFLHKLPSGPLETNAILFGKDGIGAVIDPALGSFEKLFALANLNELKIEKILLTHSHWDHFADANIFQEKTNAVLYVHALDAQNVKVPGADRLPLFSPITAARVDHLLQEGEAVFVGKLRLEVIHTPGHSPGSVCFYLPSEGILFSGDTLFFGSIGRLDLPTGDAKSMWLSLKKLSQLPSKTRVIPGHGPDTEIGKEPSIFKAQGYFNEQR